MNLKRGWCLPGKHRASPFYPVEPSSCAVHLHVSRSPRWVIVDINARSFCLEPCTQTTHPQLLKIPACQQLQTEVQGSLGQRSHPVRPDSPHPEEPPVAPLPLPSPASATSPFQEAASPGSLPLPGTSLNI